MVIGGLSAFALVFVFFVFEVFESLLDYRFREPNVPEILVNVFKLGLFCIVGAAFYFPLY